MTTFNKRFNFRASRTRAFTRAFTLAETMVSLTILGIVLASIIPTFAFFSKSVTALGNYTIMSSESRMALEVFGRDLHAAQDVMRATETELILVMPAALDGVIIRYNYQSKTDASGRTTGVVLRTKYSSSKELLSKDVLFDDVDAFKLVYYNRLSVDVSSSPTLIAEAKSVQINAKLLKKVITTNTTDYIISARFLMRNYNS